MVDSNVEATSTAAPSVATVIGRVCNTSNAPVSDVSVSIGNYNGGTNPTPGIYPSRNSLTFGSANPLYNTGSYAFTHVGTAADATRNIISLAPDECRVEYWSFTYPRCENNADGTPDAPPCNNGAVWGASNDPNDDLWL